MKKLFLLLILSFISATGYSNLTPPAAQPAPSSETAPTPSATGTPGSSCLNCSSSSSSSSSSGGSSSGGSSGVSSYKTCPDGNEPAKSVSADGYYFVYTCGTSSNEQKSSSTANSNTKAVADTDIKPGWKIQENSNFLVIDDESSYWETDEGIKEKTKLHSHSSSPTSGSSSSSGAPSCYVPPNCAPGQTCC